MILMFDGERKLSRDGGWWVVVGGKTKYHLMTARGYNTVILSTVRRERTSWAGAIIIITMIIIQFSQSGYATPPSLPLPSHVESFHYQHRHDPAGYSYMLGRERHWK